MDPGRPAVRGRGAAYLALIKKKEADSQNAPKEDPKPEEPSVSQPRLPAGRGHLLAEALKKKKLDLETTKSIDLKPSISTGESLAESVEKLQISTPSSAQEASSHREEKRPLIHDSTEPVIKRGTAGTKMPATANYIRLQIDPSKGVFEYDVRFMPQIDSMKTKQQMLYNIPQIKSINAKQYTGYQLFLPVQITKDTLEVQAENPHSNVTHQILIFFQRKRSLDKCKRLYNTLFKRVMYALQYKRLKRSYFDPKSPKIIPQHKLQLWPGFITAIDEYEGGAMLCLDVSYKVLRSQTVLEYFYDLLHLCKKDMKLFKERLMQSLVGQVILTKYNNKTYTVQDIAWDASPKDTFKTSDGEISYIDYYRNHYGININDLKQPLLVHRAKRQIARKPNKDENAESIEILIYLIPELCNLTGLTDDMRSDFKVMKDIAQYTRLTPNQRSYALKQFCRNVNTNSEAQQILADWGLHIQNATIDLEARILNPQLIIFGNDRQESAGPQAEWNRALTSNKVISAVDITNWILVCTSRDQKTSDNFFDILRKVAPQMGIYIVPPERFVVPNDSAQAYVQCIKNFYNRSPINLFVFIVPTEREDRYNAIKKTCCADLGVASQVIRSRTLDDRRKVQSVVQKVALQINAKLGGHLWSVAVPKDHGIMVCGIDTYHDVKHKSVVGFVASLNKSFTRWFGKTFFSEKGGELISGVIPLMLDALKTYFDEFGSYPRSVYVFRDGVGDGQLDHSLNIEVPQFESALAMLNSNTKLTYIIVQKRINTKIFFPGSQQGGSRGDRRGGSDQSEEYQNPPPGTIIDGEITKRFVYDYFIVSQNVRQGTVTPTHYIVLHQTDDMKVDNVQLLTYKLCHMYYNWPGTIRVPAPCQYAHKLAQLTGMNIHQQPHESLKDKLFYL